MTTLREGGRVIKKMLAALLVCVALAAAARAQVEKQFAQDRVKAPEFREVTEWLNTKPLTLEKLKGRVVVIHFLTFG